MDKFREAILVLKKLFFQETIIFLKLDIKENVVQKNLFSTNGRTIFVNNNLLEKYNISEIVFLLVLQINHIGLCHPIGNFPKEIIDNEFLSKLYNIACEGFITEYLLRDENLSLLETKFGKMSFEKIDTYNPEILNIVTQKHIFKNPYFLSIKDTYEHLKRTLKDNQDFLNDNYENSLEFNNDSEIENSFKNDIETFLFNKETLLKNDNLPSLSNFKQEILNSKDFLYECKNNFSQKWTVLLKDYFKDFLKYKSTFKTYLRHRIHKNEYLMGYDADKTINNLVIAFDISSSINENILKEFIDVLQEISCEITFKEIRFITFNTNIVTDIIYDDVCDINIKKIFYKIGGGTDCQKVFDVVTDCDLLLIMTDLEMAVPKNKNDLKTVWLVKNGACNKNKFFGEKIILLEKR